MFNTVYWSHINFFDVSAKRPCRGCLCSCLHWHVLAKEDDHNVCNVKTRKTRNAQCYFPVRTYGAVRQQIHFMCLCVSSTHGNGCSAHGSCCLFPSWMENAERYVKSSHLLHREAKHQCFLMRTTISSAHGLIKHFTFANVSVTGDCWKFSPFIKWCKAAGEKHREGITRHFLNLLNEFAASSAKIKCIGNEGMGTYRIFKVVRKTLQFWFWPTKKFNDVISRLSDGCNVFSPLSHPWQSTQFCVKPGFSCCGISAVSKID